MRNLRLQAALFGTTILAACASSGGKNASFVAANNQTVTIDRQVALTLNKAQISFVRNASSVAITVTQISILDCHNLKDYCGVKATNIVIQPGQRQEIIRIEPQDIDKPFTYRMQWRWRAASRGR